MERDKKVYDINLNSPTITSKDYLERFWEHKRGNNTTNNHLQTSGTTSSDGNSTVASNSSSAPQLLVQSTTRSARSEASLSSESNSTAGPAARNKSDPLNRLGSNTVNYNDGDGKPTASTNQRFEPQDPTCIGTKTATESESALVAAGVTSTVGTRKSKERHLEKNHTDKSTVKSCGIDVAKDLSVDDSSSGFSEEATVQNAKVLERHNNSSSFDEQQNISENTTAMDGINNDDYNSRDSSEKEFAGSNVFQHLKESRPGSDFEVTPSSSHTPRPSLGTVGKLDKCSSTTPSPSKSRTSEVRNADTSAATSTNKGNNEDDADWALVGPDDNDEDVDDEQPPPIDRHKVPRFGEDCCNVGGEGNIAASATEKAVRFCEHKNGNNTTNNHLGGHRQTSATTSNDGNLTFASDTSSAPQLPVQSTSRSARSETLLRSESNSTAGVAVLDTNDPLNAEVTSTVGTNNSRERHLEKKHADKSTDKSCGIDGGKKMSFDESLSRESDKTTGQGYKEAKRNDNTLFNEKQNISENTTDMDHVITTASHSPRPPADPVGQLGTDGGTAPSPSKSRSSEGRIVGTSNGSSTSKGENEDDLDLAPDDNNEDVDDELPLTVDRQRVPILGEDNSDEREEEHTGASTTNQAEDISGRKRKSEDQGVAAMLRPYISRRCKRKTIIYRDMDKRKLVESIHGSSPPDNSDDIDAVDKDDVDMDDENSLRGTIEEDKNCGGHSLEIVTGEDYEACNTFIASFIEHADFESALNQLKTGYDEIKPHQEELEKKREQVRKIRKEEKKKMEIKKNNKQTKQNKGKAKIPKTEEEEQLLLECEDLQAKCEDLQTNTCEEPYRKCEDMQRKIYCAFEALLSEQFCLKKRVFILSVLLPYELRLLAQDIRTTAGRDQTSKGQKQVQDQRAKIIDIRTKMLHCCDKWLHCNKELESFDLQEVSEEFGLDFRPQTYNKFYNSMLDTYNPGWNEDKAGSLNRIRAVFGHKENMPQTELRVEKNILEIFKIGDLVEDTLKRRRTKKRSTYDGSK